MQPAAVSLLIVATAGALAPPRLFFDLKTTNAAALGRIEVELAAFDSLPRLVENLRLIAGNERAPRCSFDGSRLRHAPQGPQYKWSHEFEGAGNRPAIEPSLLKAAPHSICSRFYDCLRLGKTKLLKAIHPALFSFPNDSLPFTAFVRTFLSLQERRGAAAQAATETAGCSKLRRGGDGGGDDRRDGRVLRLVEPVVHHRRGRGWQCAWAGSGGGGARWAVAVTAGCLRAGIWQSLCTAAAGGAVGRWPRRPAGL